MGAVAAMITIDVNAQASGRAELRLAHSSRLFLSRDPMGSGWRSRSRRMRSTTAKKACRGARSAGTERVAADAMAFEPLADAPPASFPIHHVKQRSLLHSRLVERPGSSPSSFTFLAASPPGDWRSAERRHSLVRVAQVTRDATLARRGPSRANREARLTALRRGVVGPGPPSRPGHDGRADAKAPRPPGIAARLRCRAFRIRGYHPRATPHPAPPSGSLLESAPHERDFGFVARALPVVNY